MKNGTRIRFLADSRNGDWVKGQVGFVEKTLATPPQNQNAIYVVKVYSVKGSVSSVDERFVWVTDKDVEVNEQLSIFDVLATIASSSDAS